jgi:hypothetical protein
MIKSRRIRWGEHVARMGRTGMRIGFWWESQKERDHQVDLDVGGRLILKLNLREIRRGYVDGILCLRVRMARVNTVMNLRVP